MPIRKIPARKLPAKCYWIVCYYPPVDWRENIKVIQVNPAELSPEIQRTLIKVGAMPSLGEVASIGAALQVRQVR
jgi:hypothetical protein